MLVVSDLTDLTPICNDILNHLGSIIIGEAGTGKSYLAFSFVKQFNKMGIPCYIYSPSNIWLKRFGQIDYITVGDKYYNPIIRAKDNLAIYRGYSRDMIQINLDRKWVYRSNGWLEARLKAMKTTLFNIRYLNGRRIKYFIGTALKIQYEQQKSLANPKPIINILEEAQNPFGTYSMNDDMSLELMTVFTQSRSDANMHYLALGHRLPDISTKINERLRLIICKTLGDRALSKVKRNLPKELRDIPKSLQDRMFLYADGLDYPIFRSPQFKAQGKPVRLTIPKPKPSQDSELWRQAIPKPKKKPSLTDKLKALWNSLFPKPVKTAKNDKEEEYEPYTAESDELNAMMAETDQQDEEFFW